MKAKWLNRTLATGPNLTLVTSQKEFDAACRHLGVSVHCSGEWIQEHQCACVTNLVAERGKHVCIVSLRLTDDKADMITTLVHEAVHVFQRHCEQIGEHTPSKEFEAYSIESIFRTLFDELAKRLEKEKA